nr:reverse transcriptase domain-containing protein [Tanacetum cinerariifolium]
MKFDRIYDHQFSRPTGTIPSNTQTNPKPSTSNDKPYRPLPARNEHVNAVFTRSGKTYDPPVNPNAKPAIFLDDSEDEADEVEKKAEPLPNKPTHADTPPLDMTSRILGSLLNLDSVPIFTFEGNFVFYLLADSVKIINFSYLQIMP